jgi:hypothetical protein
LIRFTPGVGQVWGLCEDGRVTGWRKLAQSETAFRWSELGGFEDLPTPIGCTDAGGVGIGPDGTVAGSAWDGIGNHAVVWGPTGNATLLPQPTLDGLQMGGAFDVNRSGTAVGWAYGHSHRQDDELSRAFGLLWASGAVNELDALIQEGPLVKVVAANAINDSGQIAAVALVHGHQRALRLDPL